MKRTRLSLLLISLSLAVTTACLGLTNTLTDIAQISNYTRLATSGEFGITLSEPTIEEVVYPGITYPYNVTVTNNSGTPSYLVAKVSIPDVFLIDGGSEISSQWTKIDKDINGLDLVDAYYYGADGIPSVFKSSSVLMNSLKLDDYVEILPEGSDEVGYELEVVVYAIQVTDETASLSPAQLWEEAKGI